MAYRPCRSSSRARTRTLDHDLQNNQKLGPAVGDNAYDGVWPERVSNKLSLNEESHQAIKDKVQKEYLTRLIHNQKDEPVENYRTRWFCLNTSRWCPHVCKFYTSTTWLEGLKVLTRIGHDLDLCHNNSGYEYKLWDALVSPEPGLLWKSTYDAHCN